jgi:hypothetical protein
MGIPPAPNK